jgi:hypothetical protein
VPGSEEPGTSLQIGGWAKLLTWVAHPLGFGFAKGAGFDPLKPARSSPAAQPLPPLVAGWKA